MSSMSPIVPPLAASSPPSASSASRAIQKSEVDWKSRACACFAHRLLLRAQIRMHGLTGKHLCVHACFAHRRRRQVPCALAPAPPAPSAPSCGRRPAGEGAQRAETGRFGPHRKPSTTDTQAVSTRQQTSATTAKPLACAKLTETHARVHALHMHKHQTCNASRADLSRQLLHQPLERVDVLRAGPALGCFPLFL
jgi:hypothetical protein